ncbi:MAG: lamin tail domain-containing protein, partial [Actinobacteria bacterium]|nr:lamin tail domain-containing protein [Actinomycetota bacterium]
MKYHVLPSILARLGCAALPFYVGLAALSLPCSAQVRLSQVCGAANSSGAGPNADYVELFNAGSSAVDLSTYSIHYASAVGTTWTRLGLAGTIPARGYYLVRVQNPSSTSTARPLPLPDQWAATLFLSATTGKLALIQGGVQPATGQCAIPPSGAVLVDFVGYGTGADAREASGPPCTPAGTFANNAPEPSATNAIFRVGCGATDTNENSLDWIAAVAAPRNSQCRSNGLSGAGSNTTAAVGTAPTITLIAEPCSGGTVSGGATATIDLTAVGGSPTTMGAPVGNLFTLDSFTIPANAYAGLYTLPVVLVDGANTGTAVVVLEVTSTLAPANDSCGANQAAFTIPGSGGLATGTLVNATLDAGSTACIGNGVDVYHYFTPAADAVWSIGVCQSGVNWDSVLTVHCCSPATSINAIAPVGGACPDGGCTSSVALSGGSWMLSAGVTYVIRVASFSAQATSLRSYNLRVFGAVPANDTCANATPLVFGEAVEGATPLAHTDGTSSCDPGGRDLWYTVTTPGMGDLSVDTCGSGIDTSIAVYAKCGGGELGCNDDCGGSPCSGLSSCLTLTGLPAGTYPIRVSDKGLGSGGLISIVANWGGASPPTGAGTASPSNLLPGGLATLFATVTPAVNPSSTGIQVTVDTTLIGGGAGVALFDDGVAPDVTANDNVFSRTVAVGSVTDGDKSLPLTISDAQARVGSGGVSAYVGYCAASSSSGCGVQLEYISNVTVGAINSSTACGPGYQDLTSLSTNVSPGGTVPIAVTVSEWFDSTDSVHVYMDWNHDADLVDLGEKLKLNDPGSHTYTGTIAVPLSAAPGETRLRVRLTYGLKPPCGTEFWGDVEDYTLFVVGIPAPPPNDTCSAALLVPCGGSVIADTTWATPDSVPDCGTPVTLPGVWYRATGTGFPMTASTCDSATNFDTLLTVFDGTCGALQCVGENNDDPTCTSPNRSTVTWTSSPGVTYFILVSTYGEGYGTAVLTLTCSNYCASTSTNAVPTNECILRVQIGSIDNAPAGTGQSGYVLYPLTTTIAKCGAEPITVTIDNPFAADRCTVFVDWNQNLALSDAGETFQLNGGGTHVAGVFTGTITPPYGALLGPTRMRVSMGDSSLGGYSNTNPCGTFTYGEVEDYFIDIANDGITFYEDVDGDGLGDPNGNTVVDCVPPSGYVANSDDGCPNDPFKGSPGPCGCGLSDVDSDGDLVADCNDGCPIDAAKTAPGVCGCGVSDVDSDGDLTPDCNDGCPNDANKTAPGACGCGVSELDSDGDLTPDCNDGCPNDANKTAPGACGCGVADTDTDGDGVADCVDNCDTLANPGQEDCDSDGVGDVCELGAGSFDVNANLIPDECESNGLQYCFADGSSFTCPCGNDATAGNEGCKNSSNRGATLYNSGGISAGADDVVMTVIHLPNNKSGIVFMANNQVSLPFGDGRLCTSGGTKRFQVKSSGTTG